MPERISQAVSRGERVAVSGAGGKARASEFSTWGKSILSRIGSYALPTVTLRDIYKKNSSVRWCVDTVATEVSSLPIAIVPNYSEANIKPRTLRHIVELAHFFADPNVNEESFLELIKKVLVDILVIDRGVIEKVFALGGNLLELWARDGATFHPVIDQHGVLQGYIQKTKLEQGKIAFTRSEVVYMRHGPTTTSMYGTPIIESIINEIGAVMFATDWIANSFTEDEIPPGLLVLVEIGQEAYNRAKADFQEKKGIKAKGEMRVIDNVKEVKWVDFKQSNTEMQLATLVERMDRIIYRNFGIEYELGQGDVTGLQLTEKLQKIKLMKPLARLIAWKINNEIMPEFGYDDVMFQFVVRDTVNEMSRAQASKNYVLTGMRSLNEERSKDGYPPTKGGDRKFILVGKRIIFVDALDSLTSEALDNSGREGVEEDEEQEVSEEGVAQEAR